MIMVHGQCSEIWNVQGFNFLIYVGDQMIISLMKPFIYWFCVTLFIEETNVEGKEIEEGTYILISYVPKVLHVQRRKLSMIPFILAHTNPFWEVLYNSLTICIMGSHAHTNLFLSLASPPVLGVS